MTSDILENFMNEKVVAYSDVELNIKDFTKIAYEDKDGSLEKGLLNFYNGDIIDKPVSFFEKFKKRENDFSDYWINKGFGRGYLEIMNPEYSDSPFWFLLGKGSQLGAMLSFEIRPKSILVNQIQGFPDKQNVWGSLRYPDLLLDVCWNFVKKYNISEMMVLPFFRNKWDYVQRNFQDTKKRQYDQPAKRNGFVYDEKRGVYVKKLIVSDSAGGEKVK